MAPKTQTALGGSQNQASGFAGGLMTRLRHYGIRTEEAYTRWIREYILFHQKRHPDAWGNEK